MSDDATTGPASMPLVRRLATILCADIAGYSQLMGANEERTVKVFRGHREIFESLVNTHRGRIFNTAGDAVLAEFGSAVEAVRCATEIQAALASRNARLPAEERMVFRIGINLGDVIVQGDDLLGDGVNVAARIQTATEPGGICISGSVYDQILNKLSLDFKLLGEQTYKNIARPVRTYTITEGAAVTPPKSRGPSKAPLLAGIAALAVAAAGYWGYQQYDTQRTERAKVEAQLAAQLVAQKEAAERAQRAAEDARRDALLQAQKLAADDAARRAQEERNRLEQERKALEAEKRAAAEAAKKPAALSPPAAAVAPAAPKPSVAQYDGSYNGQLCNLLQNNQKPNCWPVALLVRNGNIQGDWLGPKQQPSKVSGTIAASGNVELNLAGWTREGNPVVAPMTGRIVDDLITTSGQWRGGSSVTGSWKRGAPALAANVPPPAVLSAGKAGATFNGNWTGRLCNQFIDKPPNCWPVVLAVRDGSVEAAWLSITKKTSRAVGTITPAGAFELKISAWTPSGEPNEALLSGRAASDQISAAGKWRIGNGNITGDWKRAP